MTNHIVASDFLLTIEHSDPNDDRRIGPWLEIETFENQVEIEMGTGNDVAVAHLVMGEREASAICKLLLKWLNQEHSLPELNI